MTDTLHIVEIIAAREDAEQIEDALEQLQIPVAGWYAEDPPGAVLRIYHESATEAAARRDQVAAMIRHTQPGNSSIDITLTSIRNEDWQTAWKRFFHVDRISRRIVVRPSWEEVTAEDGDVILTLDPGMSFGTGQHGTTRACLQMLDDLSESQAPCPLLDIGCGSGILSIAAAKLGFQPVAAFDHDPDAVTIAKNNAVTNGTEKRICFFTADLARPGIRTAFPIVVANVLAHVLIEHAESIARLVSTDPGNKLILAGILDEQYESVCKRYRALGFEEATSTRIDEWRSGCFTRSAPA